MILEVAAIVFICVPVPQQILVKKLLKNNVVTPKQAEQLVYNAVNAAFLTLSEKEELKSLCDKRLHQ